MDDLDRAQELEMASRNEAIAAQRKKQSNLTYSHCIDCGEAIRPERQKIKCVCRCVQCQQESEDMRKRYGR